MTVPPEAAEAAAKVVMRGGSITEALEAAAPLMTAARMTAIEVPEDVMVTLRKLAAARDTDIAGVLGEAIGLEQVLVDALLSGSRLLIEKHVGGSRVDQLVVPDLQQIQGGAP